MAYNLHIEFVSFKRDIQVPLKGVENKSVKSFKNGATEKETLLKFERAI